MDLLLVKLTLTPVLMGAVSAASRRWGGGIGGLLAGLPLTAAPISIYVAAEQGRPFAAHAAVGAIAGLGAVTMSYLIYAEASRWLPVFWSMTCAVLADVLAMTIFQVLHVSFGVLIAIDIALVLTVFARSPETEAIRVASVRPAWDLPARLLVSTVMVLVVTVSARIVGPVISGFLATIPMIGWPLIVFAHSQDGRPEAIMVLRGITKGCFGLIAFYVIVALVLPGTNGVLTYAVALGSSVGMTSLWLLKRPRDVTGAA